MALRSHILSTKVTRTLRWLARFIGTVTALTIAAFWLAESRFIALRVSISDALQMVCILITLIGFLIAWRHEMIGGLAMLLGMGSFYLLEWRLKGAPPVGLLFKTAVFTGILFLLIWIHEKASNRHLTRHFSGGKK